MAWLGKIETDSILIKEKRKHLSKMSDRVSKDVMERKCYEGLSREGFIEVYIDNRRIFVIIYIIYANICVSLVKF
jgi:hypothetical protein